MAPDSAVSARAGQLAELLTTLLRPMYNQGRVPTIQAWLEQFAAAYAQKPEPEGRAVVIELDEMWHYLKKSPSRSGSGRLGIGRQGSWWTGNAAVVTGPPSTSSLPA